MVLHAPEDRDFIIEHEHNVCDNMNLTYTVFEQFNPMLNQLKELEMGSLRRFCNVYDPQPNSAGNTEYPSEMRSEPVDSRTKEENVIQKPCIVAYNKRKKLFMDKELLKKKLSKDHNVTSSGINWLPNAPGHLFLKNVKLSVVFIGRNVKCSLLIETDSYQKATFCLHYYYLTMLSPLQPQWNKACSFEATGVKSGGEFNFTVHDELDELPIYFALQSSAVGKAYFPFAVLAERGTKKMLVITYSEMYKKHC